MAKDAAQRELRATTVQPGADGVRCPRARETATEPQGGPATANQKNLTGKIPVQPQGHPRRPEGHLHAPREVTGIEHDCRAGPHHISKRKAMP